MFRIWTHASQHSQAKEKLRTTEAKNTFFNWVVRLTIFKLWMIFFTKRFEKWQNYILLNTIFCHETLTVLQKEGSHKWKYRKKINRKITVIIDLQFLYNFLNLPCPYRRERRPWVIWPPISVELIKLCKRWMRLQPRDLQIMWTSYISNWYDVLAWRPEGKVWCYMYMLYKHMYMFNVFCKTLYMILVWDLVSCFLLHHWIVH